MKAASIRSVSSDAQWERVAPLLPGDPGRLAADNRRQTKKKTCLTRISEPLIPTGGTPHVRVHYTHRAGHRCAENGRGTAVRAGQAGALRPSPPHGDGAVDPLARPPARKRAICSQCLLLRAKGLGGSHRDRSDPSVAAGTGLRLDARHSQPRAGRGLAPRHRRRAQGRRPDLPAALARRTHLPSVAAARRHASGRTLGDQA